MAGRRTGKVVTVAWIADRLALLSRHPNTRRRYLEWWFLGKLLKPTPAQKAAIVSRLFTMERR